MRNGRSPRARRGGVANKRASLHAPRARGAVEAYPITGGGRARGWRALGTGTARSGGEIRSDRSREVGRKP